MATKKKSSKPVKKAAKGRAPAAKSAKRSAPASEEHQA